MCLFTNPATLDPNLFETIINTLISSNIASSLSTSNSPGLLDSLLHQANYSQFQSNAETLQSNLLSQNFFEPPPNVGLTLPSNSSFQPTASTSKSAASTRKPNNSMHSRKQDTSIGANKTKVTKKKFKLSVSCVFDYIKN